mgnify:CR=1 FL=1
MRTQDRQLKVFADCMDRPKSNLIPEAFSPSKYASAELITICRLVVNEWHSKMSNVDRKEPLSVITARAFLDKATGGL